jgi:uncharacterized protein YrzB (UPF0473 family)
MGEMKFNDFRQEIVMDEIWAKILKGLRESGNNSLFTLTSNMDNVEFTTSSIVLTAGNDAEYNVLNKNMKLFNKLSGGDYVVVRQKNDNAVKNNFVEILQEMFEDKLCLA